MARADSIHRCLTAPSVRWRGFSASWRGIPMRVGRLFAVSIAAVAVVALGFAAWLVAAQYASYRSAAAGRETASAMQRLLVASEVTSLDRGNVNASLLADRPATAEERAEIARHWGVARAAFTDALAVL